MKFLAIFVVLASQFLISNGHHIPSLLRHEIGQILELVDFAKIHEICREYSANDPSVQQLSEYLHSREFKAAWTVFISSSEIEDILEWTRKHSIDLYHEIEKSMEESVVVEPEVKPSYHRSKRTIATFQDEITAQVKLEEMKELIHRLRDDGNDFTHLMLIFQVSRPALEKLFNADEIRLATTHLEELGVDIEQLKNVVQNLLGWM